MNVIKALFSKKNLILYACIALLVVVDIVVKRIVQANIELFDTVIFIDGFINFTYVQNKGVAWGIFAEADVTIYLGILSLIFALAFLALNTFVFKKGKNLLYYISFCLIVGGTIGNMIDRLFLQYVVDFIKLDFMSFPVFNIADAFLVVGVILFCVWFLTYTIKEDDSDKDKEARDKVQDSEDKETNCGQIEAKQSCDKDIEKVKNEDVEEKQNEID